MRIVGKAASGEACAEAGWSAWDYRLDGPLTAEFIQRLRPLGSFVFLSGLKRPFFKIEAEHFLMRGMEGDDGFRLALHRDYPEEMERVEALIGKLSDQTC